MIGLKTNRSVNVYWQLKEDEVVYVQVSLYKKKQATCVTYSSIELKVADFLGALVEAFHTEVLQLNETFELPEEITIVIVEAYLASPDSGTVVLTFSSKSLKKNTKVSHSD